MGTHQGISEIINQYTCEFEHFGLYLDYLEFQPGDMIGYAYQPITAYDIVTNRMEKAFHDVIRDLVGESFVYIIGTNSYTADGYGKFESQKAKVLAKMKVARFDE